MSVAAGQVAALWDGDGEWCLGGGVITCAISVPELAQIETEDEKKEKSPVDAANNWQWWWVFFL